MTRAEQRRRLAEQAERTRIQQEKERVHRRIALALLGVGSVAAGVGGGFLILYCMAYGMLKFAVGSVVWMAAVPALAAAVYFTLVYGIELFLLRRFACTREKAARYARWGTALVFVTALVCVAVVLILDAMAG